MRRTTTMTTIAALGGTALLLAGCSGGSDASAGTDETGGEAAANVFEFQVNGIEPAEEIAVRVPDDLREAMGSEADGLVLNGFTVRAHDVEGAEFCAGLTATSTGPTGSRPVSSRTTRKTSPAPRASSSCSTPPAKARSTPWPARSMRSTAALASWATTTLRWSGLLRDDALRTSIAEGRGYRSSRSTPRPRHAHTHRVVDRSARSKTLGRELRPGRVLCGFCNAPGSDSSDATSIDEFDPNATEEGTFVAADHSSAIVVGDCAASATDPDNAFEVGLGSVDSDGEASSIAEVQLSVMTDGTVGVAGEVEGYMRDANENWIKG